MKIDLKNLTIRKASEAMKRGDFTARELAQAYLDEIKKKNPCINAYLEIYDDVLKQADEAQKFVGKNFLAGIPLAIKDNILIKGRKAQSASKILDGYVAPYDATVIEKLKKEHVVFIGRTNMDEFAMGGSTENSAFGVTQKSDGYFASLRWLIRWLGGSSRYGRGYWSTWFRHWRLCKTTSKFLRSRRTQTDLWLSFSPRTYGHGFVT